MAAAMPAGHCWRCRTALQSACVVHMPAWPAALQHLRTSTLADSPQCICQFHAFLMPFYAWLPACLPADQMLSDAELGGFVEFGSDPDAIAAAQRRLRDQARAASAATVGAGLEAEGEEGEAEEAGDGRKSRRGRNASRPRELQIPEELLPKVAIVGRPNVGKSGG